MANLTEEELKELNEQVKKILEEREKLLFDIRRIESSVSKPAVKGGPKNPLDDGSQKRLF